MRVSKFVARWLFLKPALTTQLSLRAHGRDELNQVDQKRAFIVASNHTSHLDGVIVMKELPWRLARRISTASAADFWFKSRLRSLPVRILMNTFPVERSETNRHKGLAGQLLENNIPLMIMPEGSRSRTGAMGKFKPGAAALAIKYDIPIIPAAIVGAFEAWPPGKKMWKAGRPKVTINFGKPLSPKPGETVEQFNKRLRSAVAKLYNQKRT